jgi:hypothetical protein
MKMRGLRPRLTQAHLQYAEDSLRKPLSSRTEEARFRESRHRSRRPAQVVS